MQKYVTGKNKTTLSVAIYNAQGDTLPISRSYDSINVYYRNTGKLSSLGTFNSLHTSVSTRLRFGYINLKYENHLHLTLGIYFT